MTVWDASGIAYFATQAGASRRDALTMTAIAIASSRGDDAYEYQQQPGASVDARGLWALDVVAHPEFDRLDLFDPQINARAAWSLHLAASRLWTMFPAYGSPPYGEALGEALALLGDVGYFGAGTAAQSPGTNTPQLQHTLGRLRLLRARVAEQYP